MTFLGVGYLYMNWENLGKKYAEDYYDKGGKMDQQIPEEMRKEYVSFGSFVLILFVDRLTKLNES